MSHSECKFFSAECRIGRDVVVGLPMLKKKKKKARIDVAAQVLVADLRGGMGR